MDKVVLQINDIFSQAWKGCQKPMWFKVLNIDSSIEVECHSFDGLTVFPEVWSLDSTEIGFEIGDYKIGRVPLDSIFVSHLKNFDYVPKNRNRKIPLIVQYPCRDICVYHSYKWIAFDDAYIWVTMIML